MSPCTTAKPKTGEAILSGMLISQDVNGQWVKGCAADATPYIAWHDQNDTDVLSSGLLLGLSCAGQYEIETAFFDNTKVYVQDSPLCAGTTAGQLALATLSGSANDIVGFATRGGRQDATAINSQAVPTGTPPKLYLLAFRTQWIPNGGTPA